jgi:branched-chain amino acid transport system permease protein
MLRWNLPFGVGLVIGTVIAVVFAALFGRAILRLRGHYFAICTLGLAEVMTAIVSNLEITGRNVGLVLPLLRSDVLFFELSLALMVVATLIVLWISRSRFGFGLIAIRENEEAAAAMGVDTTRYKVLAFSLSAAVTALAGGIHAYWITFIDPVSAFDIGLNVKMIIVAVFGGAGSVLGPVLGSFVLSGISEMLSTYISTLASLFFGAVIVVAIVFMPRGVADLIRRFDKYRWRYFAENVRANRL